jgi:hypothetical protein
MVNGNCFGMNIKKKIKKDRECIKNFILGEGEEAPTELNDQAIDSGCTDAWVEFYEGVLAECEELRKNCKNLKEMIAKEDELIIHVYYKLFGSNEQIEEFYEKTIKNILKKISNLKDSAHENIPKKIKPAVKKKKKKRQKNILKCIKEISNRLKEGPKHTKKEGVLQAKKAADFFFKFDTARRLKADLLKDVQLHYAIKRLSLTKCFTNFSKADKKIEDILDKEVFDKIINKSHSMRKETKFELKAKVIKTLQGALDIKGQCWEAIESKSGQLNKKGLGSAMISFREQDYISLNQLKKIVSVLRIGSSSSGGSLQAQMSPTTPRKKKRKSKKRRS